MDKEEEAPIIGQMKELGEREFIHSIVEATGGANGQDDATILVVGHG